MKGDLPERQPDAQGAGHYGAPRGSRTHKGIDMACYPGTDIYSPVSGTVVKLGYPYANDLSFRYVMIRDNQNRIWRVMYVDPEVEVNDTVNEKTIIGKSQALKYDGITHHVHVDVKVNDEFIDPTDLV